MPRRRMAAAGIDRVMTKRACGLSETTEVARWSGFGGLHGLNLASKRRCRNTFEITDKPLDSGLESPSADVNSGSPEFAGKCRQSSYRTLVQQRANRKFTGPLEGSVLGAVGSVFDPAIGFELGRSAGRPWK